MSSYISRVFSRPQINPTTKDREPELNNPTPDPEQPPTPISPPDTPAPHTQASASQIVVEKRSEDQFQIMLSSILAQNSNLLAQNNEQARVIDRLSICLTDAEAGQKKLREEMRGMFRNIMDILGELKVPNANGAGGAGTPVSNDADAGNSNTGHLVLQGEVEEVFSGMINENEHDHEVEDGVLETPDMTYWNRGQGKGKEREIEGVDPNVFKRPTFSSLDTPVNEETREAMDINMNIEIWNGEEEEGGEEMVDPIRPQRQSTEIEGMTGIQLSAFAQQVVEMQNQEDTPEAGPSTSTTMVPTTNAEIEKEDPITPIRPTRPIRQSASKPRDYSIILALPDDLEEGSVKKGTNKNTPKGGAGSAKKRKSKSPVKAKVQVPKAKRQRAFNGKVSMTARPLCRSDGVKRGEGVWPEKGQNTVKGNMQEIVCDVCNGRVHWACAGLQDDSVPPDEWDCPDCEHKLTHGVLKTTIEKAPQTHCVRPTCILREKKKIVMKDGDSEEFYVEKYIGRRAVGRRADGTSRIFEYLVKWLGWSRDTSTWEHENKFPTNNHFADDFLAECEIYNINAKKRVAILPEATRWFDEDGDIIDTNSESDEEEIDARGGGNVEEKHDADQE